ncbi:MAG TPA: hypothetical protein VHE35_33595 [Kofleriaceae bacterium]|nr:hypothetical protein [Kofleriaceae bacterium]
MSAARAVVRLLAAAAVLSGCRTERPAKPEQLDPRACTPDPRASGPGLSPAAGTRLAGKVGRPFRAVLTYVAPTEGTAGGDVTITGAELQVGGALPSGLLITCGTDGCRIAPGERGCIVIAGTPTQAARVTIRVDTVLSAVRGSGGAGEAVPLPTVTAAYPLVVDR